MSEVNNIIKSGIDTFKDQLTTSKSFKKFKNKATKFGETGQFNVKDFSNLGKPLMKDFKKSGKNAALKTLKGLTGMLEGKTTTIKGIKVRGSGHPKDSASGTNDKPLLDYSKIRAKAPITNDGKKNINPSKNEVIAASYSWRNELGL